MSDDWRLRIELASAAQARELAQTLQSGEVEHELDEGFGARVVISLDDALLFAYAGSSEQLGRAAGTIRQLATQRGWSIQAEVARWHPVAEEWEDPDAPLPRTQDAIAAERAQLIEEEQAESQAAGRSQWEVRVECGSHHDTVALARTLSDEGLTNVRRWRFLLIGAADEESALALAARVRAQVPSGSTVTVEQSSAAIEAGRPFNPYALLGGLGG